MSLTDMALSSNERREQNILCLRRAFNDQQVITVQSAVLWSGYSRQTVIKWAKDGDIPLFDEQQKDSVVKLTVQNRPVWLT